MLNICAALLSALPSQGASPVREIDSYLAGLERLQLFSGAVVVAKGDKMLFRKAYGFANRDFQARNTPDTVFRVASLTKTFTAGAILALEKAGKLTFADKLSKFLPSFPRGDEITLGHLLGHSSGVGAPPLDDWLHRESTLDEAVSEIAKTPFKFDPGKGGAYSNSGYTLLAKVVEVASGLEYNEFLRKTFWEPLGMPRTGHFAPTQVVKNRAEGYVPGPPPDFAELIPPYDMTPYTGAGSLSTSADDLAKWGRAIAENRFYDVFKLNWPVGWGRKKVGDDDAIDQTGIPSGGGFTSGILVVPKTKLCVVVLSNLQTPATFRAMTDIPTILAGGKPKTIEVPARDSATSDTTKRRLGRYRNDRLGNMTIFLRNGHAYFRWGSSGVRNYLSPAGSDTFFAPGELATFTWKDGDTFTFKNPFDTLDFRRIENE